MNLTLRRTAAAAALPLLLLSVSACGGEGDDSDSASSAEASTEATEEATSDATDEAAETPAEEPSMPSAGDIPDPMDDPEGFESYLATMYQDAGLSKDQSTCMASAFMDNIDLEAMTDPNAVSSAMNDPELTKAITKCM